LLENDPQVFDEKNSRVLITGAAGFIGSATARALVRMGYNVTGIDNHNDYYDVTLKSARVSLLNDYENYRHCKIDISKQDELTRIFENFKPNVVINLAAQVGVRYSVLNPSAYVSSNIVGFSNILECCRKYGIGNLIYASSSSVYGANSKLPFSTSQNTDHPLSFYAATKKSNELMAHSYSHIHQVPTIGLRFFTVYGPWGRPDMALFKFTKSILENKPIQIFNGGKHKRDFTFIDDVVNGIVGCVSHPAAINKSWRGDAPSSDSSSAPWQIYNVGNSSPVTLMDYICELENALGITAIKEFLPLQEGDMEVTYADIEGIKSDRGYSPTTSLKLGISKFVDWYVDYYKK
jgi:UDP-glucuronate 4-epimerase